MSQLTADRSTCGFIPRLAVRGFLTVTATRRFKDNLRRLEQVVLTGKLPGVQYEKAKSEVNRLRGCRDNERIESERNLQGLGEARKKLELPMRG